MLVGARSGSPFLLVKVGLELIGLFVFLQSVEQPNHPMEGSHALFFSHTALLMHDVALFGQGHHVAHVHTDERKIRFVEGINDVKLEVAVKRHHGMVGHEHDKGVGGVFLFTG